MEVKETVSIKEMMFLVPGNGSNRVQHEAGCGLQGQQRHSAEFGFGEIHLWVLSHEPAGRRNVTLGTQRKQVRMLNMRSASVGRMTLHFKCSGTVSSSQN